MLATVISPDLLSEEIDNILEQFTEEEIQAAIMKE